MRQKPSRAPLYSQVHKSWVIPLTQGVTALVDEDIAHTLAQYLWYARVDLGRKTAAWYAVRSGGKSPHQHPIWMHREIMDGAFVDHVIHFPSHMKLIDNRRTNLRPCTQSQNTCNSRRSASHKNQYKGIHWSPHHRKWRSYVGKDRRKIFVGIFADPHDAAVAYDKKAVELHGEFAVTNKSLGLL